MTEAATAAKKRAMWKPDEDLLLAQHVALALPYRAGYGEVMPAWGRIADALASTGAFGARVLTDRACYARFEKLVEARRRAPARETDEAPTALADTLDALLADMDAFVDEDGRPKEQLKRAKHESPADSAHNDQDASSARSGPKRASTRLESSSRRSAHANTSDNGTTGGGLPGLDRLKDAVATLVEEALAHYTATAAATHARDWERREKLAERKLAVLREERRLDREARAEDARLARELQAQQRREEREERERALAAEREERMAFLRDLLLQQKRSHRTGLSSQERE